MLTLANHTTMFHSCTEMTGVWFSRAVLSDALIVFLKPTSCSCYLGPKEHSLGCRNKHTGFSLNPPSSFFSACLCLLFNNYTLNGSTDAWTRQMNGWWKQTDDATLWMLTCENTVCLLLSRQYHIFCLETMTNLSVSMAGCIVSTSVHKMHKMNEWTPSWADTQTFSREVGLNCGPLSV